ncbi:MAG: response regulator BaeR [Candidatus Saccharibacteria bacterium]|nr:response regulator BaeR [Candidatus Saccharibacteria bacterium]
MNVVLVEDDILLSQHFERSLTRAGHMVVTSPHALGAIKLIDETKPGAIVLDMLLTGSTALPLLHELQSHDDLARIPVIMVTSLADDMSLATLKPYGVTHLLDKTTMHPDDLVAAVRSASL